MDSNSKEIYTKLHFFPFIYHETFSCLDVRLIDECRALHANFLTFSQLLQGTWCQAIVCVHMQLSFQQRTAVYM